MAEGVETPAPGRVVAAADPASMRGRDISREVLDDLLAGVPRDDAGRPLLVDADFSKATFAPDARFGTVRFSGPARFSGATFRGKAWFEDTTFSDDARFGGVTFEGDAHFGGVTFGGEARFGSAVFEEEARFSGARCEGEVRFDAAALRGLAWFDDATIAGSASFDGATFSSVASFDGVAFGGPVAFDRAAFASQVSFVGATFARLASFDQTTFTGESWFTRAELCGGAWFGEARFTEGVSYRGAWLGGDVVFDEAEFAGPVDVDGANSGSVSFRRARFLAEQSLHLRSGGPVVFMGSRFAQRVHLDTCAPSLDLSGATLSGPARVTLRSCALVAEDLTVGRPLAVESAPSTLLESARALMALVTGVGFEPGSSALEDLSGSVLDAPVVIDQGVSLGECDLAGVHNLQQLQFASMAAFATGPHAGRRVLAVERQWRVERAVTRRWSVPASPRRRWRAPRHPVRHQEPHQIGATYRALRLAREASGDAPGTADLYYGEMEMRRHDPTRSRGERAVVWLYWLFSGYGLRVLRPLFALGITLLACTWLLATAGFRHGAAPENTFLFALSSSLSVLRPSDDGPALYQWGQVALIVLKLAAPLFLGLTLLSIRGRVQR